MTLRFRFTIAIRIVCGHPSRGLSFQVYGAPGLREDVSQRADLIGGEG